MTDTTSVPSIQFTAAGLILPAESAVLSGVQSDMNASFGGNLNPALNTPQGQLASSTTAIIGEANNTFAEFVNQINPDVADGFMQDAIARLYFLNRNPAIPTAVQCDCVGLAGTVIPLGAQAKATDGNLYLCTQSGTIPVSGTISLPFACAVAGPIACPIGSVNQISQVIPGWDTVNNTGAGALGANTEGRADFEYRRRNSVALNAHGSLSSVYAAVFDVANVLDVYAYENPTSAPITVGATSVSLAAHSLYVAAVGGASADIANAIWTKKDLGCDTNGSTSVTVTDQSGYAIPYPTYTIKYQIPAALPIKFDVQIANSSALPSDIVTQVKNAIIAAFSGADGGSRARIGSTLFASRYYAPVALISPSVSILSILIGTSSPTLASLTVGIDKTPTIAASDISVTLV